MVDANLTLPSLLQIFHLSLPSFSSLSFLLVKTPSDSLFFTSRVFEAGGDTIIDKNLQMISDLGEKRTGSIFGLFSPLVFFK